MRRTSMTVALLMAGAASLTACSDDAKYCADLAGYVAAASRVDPSKPAEYAKLVDEAKKMESKAPEQVKADWKVVVSFAEQAKAAGVDKLKLAALSKRTPALTRAGQHIATHAKDACKVDLPKFPS
jgi:hypothetical protein